MENSYFYETIRSDEWKGEKLEKLILLRIVKKSDTPNNDFLLNDGFKHRKMLAVDTRIAPGLFLINYWKMFCCRHLVFLLHVETVASLSALDSSACSMFILCVMYTFSLFLLKTSLGLPWLMSGRDMILL